MKRILSALILSLAAACGGSAEPAPAQPAAPPETAPAPAHEEHAEFSPEAAAFHDVLSPIWHADAGAKRTDDACAATGDMLARTAPMKDASKLPADKQQAYGEAVTALEVSVNELAAACKVDGRPGFDAAFTKVHEAFHAVVAFFGHEEPAGDGHHHE